MIVLFVRENIPEVLFSSIRKDDPYRASKVLQIERWCYANWDLHRRNGRKAHSFLAQILSNENCWQKVYGLHGVKLDRHLVGKKLSVASSDNPFSRAERYRIACQCCLEEDIISLFEERKRRLLAQGESSLLEYDHLVNPLVDDRLTHFWSHVIGGYISKLKLNCRHPYEYGLECALDCGRAEAVQFFWNKIKSLPEEELNTQQKDGVFMKIAVLAGGIHYSRHPEIFEFCFSQISSAKYPELLEKDLARNGYYNTLYTLKDCCSFDNLKTLFNCLRPTSISERHFYTLLWSILTKSLEAENYSKYYADAGVELFTYMWMKKGFRKHRFFTLNKEVTVGSRGAILIPLVEKGYMEQVWIVLNKANPNQIKKFMNSRDADRICSILKERGVEDSLNKFLSYGLAKEVEANSI